MSETAVMTLLLVSETYSGTDSTMYSSSTQVSDTTDSTHLQSPKTHREPGWGSYQYTHPLARVAAIESEQWQLDHVYKHTAYFSTTGTVKYYSQEQFTKYLQLLQLNFSGLRKSQLPHWFLILYNNVVYYKSQVKLKTL